MKNLRPLLSACATTRGAAASTLVCAALALASGASGCVWHLDRDAPGDIDPRIAPTQIEVQAVELPTDPGEHVVTARIGPYAIGGGGFVPGRQDTGRGFGEFGLEVSLSRFDLDLSHTASEHIEIFLGGPEAWKEEDPWRNMSLNLGWSAVALSPPDEVKLGRPYLEIQRDMQPSGVPGGVAAGATFDLADKRAGLQASAFWMGNYVRVTWLPGGEMAFTGGVILKLPVAWVWSR